MNDTALLFIGAFCFRLFEAGYSINTTINGPLIMFRIKDIALTKNKSLSYEVTYPIMTLLLCSIPSEAGKIDAEKVIRKLCDEALKSDIDMEI